MSLLEIGSRNIGRECTLVDVNYFRSVISLAASTRDVDLWIAGSLATIRLLDIAHGRVASSEAARLRAEVLLKDAFDILNLVG